MMICGKANECAENCAHKEPHKKDDFCIENCHAHGMEEPKCIEYKKEPVMQKLEELTDQTAKADAGKLRYDLIEGELIPDHIEGAAFEYLKPGALRLNEINNAINECRFIIGSHTRFLKELAKVYTFGCIKYSEKSWQSVPNGRARYEAAIFRHIKDYKDGEWINHEDGGCLHVAQICWNLIAVKWFILREK